MRPRTMHTRMHSLSPPIRCRPFILVSWPQPPLVTSFSDHFGSKINLDSNMTHTRFGSTFQPFFLNFEMESPIVSNLSIIFRFLSPLVITILRNLLRQLNLSLVFPLINHNSTGVTPGVSLAKIELKFESNLGKKESKNTVCRVQKQPRKSKKYGVLVANRVLAN